ncbi:DUF7527 domain-containing protein [Halegenticoccus soli]|uniref:DUF7527 domain-containing protein n=1 Tax=Halegenticoccus soli TaxID=1985678 RepID=UPI000C6E5D8D|nr:hypothetical protein [Halegenticoccus soli]
MKGEIVEAVTGWDSRPFSGGYAGLRDLADRGFTGAVSGGSAWAFALNGHFLGVFDGSVEAFEDADGTAYAAPDPSLPLLYAMRLRGGEPRARYYTNDTPLAEADATLSAGNFTGYVELSENVLSGDYYVVYYGGKSMSVAFVGSGGTLVTGDEAFERAADEVGIYEVTEVDLDIVEIPEPRSTAEAASEGSTAGAASDGPTEPETKSDGDDAGAEDGSATGGPVPTETGSGDGAAQPDDSEPTRDASRGASTEREPTTPPEAEPASDGPDAAAPESSASEAGALDATGGASAPASRSNDVFSEEAEWRNAKSIPALDPRRSAPAGDADGPAEADRAESAEGRRETAAGERDGAESGAERLAAERDRQREEAERLRARVRELEAEVERLEEALAGGDGAPTAERTMDPEAALEGTNLFVRYGTKGGGTLEKAHAGEATREEVNGNLRVEHHTSFDDEGLRVDGRSFEEFLRGTVEYRFVRWVVRDLLYEIAETNSEVALEDLFDAIPRIDRAELRGDVAIESREDGEERRERVAFDVVLRDRMGNPLLVANVNGSREPATEGMMTGLIERASAVGESAKSLGGACFVTASFFEPEALEAAADATGGGLLSRGRRKSFVRLSRKRGFHLCLVEARSGDFHVTVPEL